MKYIFRPTEDGKRIAVHDSFADNEQPTGYLIQVEDEETGRGRGFIIDQDPTESFYSSREEAASFLRGVRIRLP